MLSRIAARHSTSFAVMVQYPSVCRWVKWAEVVHRQSFVQPLGGSFLPKSGPWSLKFLHPTKVSSLAMLMGFTLGKSNPVPTFFVKKDQNPSLQMCSIEARTNLEKLKHREIELFICGRGFFVAIFNNIEDKGSIFDKGPWFSVVVMNMAILQEIALLILHRNQRGKHLKRKNSLKFAEEGTIEENPPKPQSSRSKPSKLTGSTKKRRGRKSKVELRTIKAKKAINLSNQLRIDKMEMPNQRQETKIEFVIKVANFIWKDSKFGKIDATGKSGECWSSIWEEIRVSNPQNVILSSDFNSILELEDKRGGIFTHDPVRDSIKQGIIEFELVDICPKTGWFTWNNRRMGSSSISERLDIFLISSSLLNIYSAVETNVLRGSHSNHWLVFFHFDQAMIPSGKRENLHME
eukprot:Gb_05893 [translate_table: standard]